jgi:hypothetical protein
VTRLKPTRSSRSPEAVASIFLIPWVIRGRLTTGELDVDLRSNIAAEARAKIVYERLINFCDDGGTKDALQFLMTREITHMKAFAAALDSLGVNPIARSHIRRNLIRGPSFGSRQSRQTQT